MNVVGAVDLTDNKSTLVQVTACCLMVLSHYLNQVDPDFQSHMASLGLNELKFQEAI